MDKSKEIQSLDMALDEIKEAKEKLSKLRQIVQSINGNGIHDKEDKDHIVRGAKRVKALVKKAQKNNKL